MATTILTVRDLRRRWKPHKERLAKLRGDHPTAVRFHRACSWLDQSEQLDAGQEPDTVLIQQWVALNALYGQWDADAREPGPERAAWKVFLERILSIDETSEIRSVLVEHKQLVVAILENAYLNRYFWEDPTEPSKSRHTKGRFRAHSWYVENRWLMIAEQLLDRIYLLRCQVVHGASTYGSRLNRDALKHCTTMMRLMIPAILQVWVHHGADEDWGPLCYPPVGNRTRQTNLPSFARRSWLVRFRNARSEDDTPLP